MDKDDYRVERARKHLAERPFIVPPALPNALALGVIAAYEEGVRVNVGLIAENAALKKKIAELTR